MVCPAPEKETACFELLNAQPTFEIWNSATFDIWAGNLVYDIGDVDIFHDDQYLYINVLNAHGYQAVNENLKLNVEK